MLTPGNLLASKAAELKSVLAIVESKSTKSKKTHYSLLLVLRRDDKENGELGKVLSKLQADYDAQSEGAEALVSYQCQYVGKDAVRIQ